MANKSFIKSGNTIICEDALKFSFSFEGIVFITGIPGIGKSRHAVYLRDKYESVYYISAENASTKARFLKLMIKEFDVYTDNTEDYEVLFDKLIYEIQKDSARKVLIIDEGTYVTSHFINVIHRLFNNTLHNLGLVILGPFDFVEKIENQLNRKGLREFYSRCSTYYSLERISKDEVKKACKNNEIADSSIINKLHKICPDFRTLYQEIDCFLLENGKIELTDLKERKIISINDEIA